MLGRHWGLPVVAGVWEEGKRPQLVPGFQEDLATSWSWPCEDQVRVHGLGEPEEVSVGRECEETNGMT